MLHRHDVRVAIASGMFLRQLGVDDAKRLEILFFIAPVYWTWSTSHLLRSIVARYGEWSSGDSVARADLWQTVWDEMVRDMGNFQVVVGAGCDVSLVCREKSKTMGGASQGVHKYHSFMNPSSRRTATVDFEVLLDDLRERRLCRACEGIADLFRRGVPSYNEVFEILKHSGVKLFLAKSARRTRLRGAQPEVYSVSAARGSLFNFLFQKHLLLLYMSTASMWPQRPPVATRAWASGQRITPEGSYSYPLALKRCCFSRFSTPVKNQVFQAPTS